MCELGIVYKYISVGVRERLTVEYTSQARGIMARHIWTAAGMGAVRICTAIVPPPFTSDRKGRH